MTADTIVRISCDECLRSREFRVGVKGVQGARSARAVIREEGWTTRRGRLLEDRCPLCSRKGD